MIVEGEAPTGSQQGGTTLEQGRAPRYVAPHIEAHNDVKGRRGQGDSMNVPEAKLHQMADPGVACPRHGLRMADRGKIDADDVTAELLGQIARGSPGPAARIQDGRPGRDPGPPRQVRYLDEDRCASASPGFLETQPHPVIF